MHIDLDSVDQQIIQELRLDGRLANTEIARRLGVGEGTVRYRIQRLVGAGVIQVTAIVNLLELGYELDVRVGIQCEAARVEEIASAIAAMDEVFFVATVTGRYDIYVGAFFRSRAALRAFLTKRVAKMSGIVRTETLFVLRVTKRNALFDTWETPPSQETRRHPPAPSIQVDGQGASTERVP